MLRKPPLALIEALRELPIRALTMNERQIRHRHGALDPRISELLVLAVRLKRENQRLRQQAREHGAKLAEKSSIRLEPVADPLQHDGHQYPPLPAMLDVTDLVRVKPAAKGSKRYGHDALDDVL